MAHLYNNNCHEDCGICELVECEKYKFAKPSNFVTFNPFNATGLCIPSTAHTFQNFQTRFLGQFVFYLSSTACTLAKNVVFESKSLTGIVLYANKTLPVRRHLQKFTE